MMGLPRSGIQNSLQQRLLVKLLAVVGAASNRLLPLVNCWYDVVRGIRALEGRLLACVVG